MVFNLIQQDRNWGTQFTLRPSLLSWFPWQTTPAQPQPWLPEIQVGHLTSTLGLSPLTNFQQTQCLSVLPTLIPVSQLQQIHLAWTQVTTARTPVRTHTSGPPSHSWCPPLTLSLIFLSYLFLYNILKHSHGHPDILEVTSGTRTAALNLDVDHLRQETTQTKRNPAFK